MSIPLRVLIVEDNPNDVELATLHLRQAGFQPDWKHVETEADYLAALEPLPDLILSDWNLSDFSGLRALRLLTERDLDIPFIIVSGGIGEEATIDALSKRADDYVLKGRPARLGEAVRRALEDKQLREQSQQTKKTLYFLTQRGWAERSGDFFEALAQYLGETLAIDYIFIDQVCQNGKTAQTLANYWLGEIRPNFEYALKDTPCENIYGNKLCTYAEHIQKKFPRDFILTDMSAESYSGIPLWDSKGNPIGLIALLHRKPLKNIALIESLLQIVASHAGHEIERKQAEEDIRKLNASLEQRVEERTRELHDAQDQLVRQEKLAVLGQVAGSMGHELRNPLGVISNAVYFLKMVQSDASDKIKEYLNIIENETRASEKIVTDLLDFTRIESINRQAVSAPQVIRQTLERFSAPESIQVTLDLPDDLPKFYVDPQQVVQVLGNLVLNAYQAMGSGGASSTGSTHVPKGGKLTISAHAAHEMICIVVQDTGVGILPENINKLFDPLFSTKTHGVGLGLAISRKLIEANGGSIQALSEAGVGSAFSIYLPVYKEL